MCASGTPLRLRNLDPDTAWVEAIGFFPHTMSTTDPSHQMAGLCYQWWSLTSNRSPASFIYRPQTKAWTVRTRCETCWRCSSKPDPPDLLQSLRRCPAITRLEACSRSTSHYMDPSDPPGHGNTGDWCSRAGRGQIVLATNRIATAGCYGWSLRAMMMMMMIIFIVKLRSVNFFIERILDLIGINTNHSSQHFLMKTPITS